MRVIDEQEVLDWRWRRTVRVALWTVGAIVALIIAAFALNGLAHAGADDGRGKGPHCSPADGRALTSADWGTHGGHYWIIVDGARYAVPPEAVVARPNKGPAVAWPIKTKAGETLIRCFKPGRLG